MAKGQQERSRGQQAEEVEKRQGEDLVYMSERRIGDVKEDSLHILSLTFVRGH
jgi:sarcosine oxidase delta subunit